MFLISFAFLLCLIQSLDHDKMTMWSTDADVITGSMCEYANSNLGGRSAPSAVAPSIQSLHYCATNVAILGQACGNCYEVEYDGSQATDAGRAGKAIVQIVDGGATHAFDCQESVFEIITGATTGVFPITYKQVDCDVATGGPRAVVVDGSYANNGNNVKIVFANLAQRVVGAKMSITTVADGSIQDYTFTRSGNSAVWRGNGFGDYGTNKPEGGATTFTLTMGDGSTVVLTNCFSSWPQAGGEWCSVQSGTAAPSLIPTTSMPTFAPTHAPTSPTEFPTTSVPTFVPTFAPSLKPIADENCADIALTSTCVQYNSEWNMCDINGNWWRSQCAKTCGICGNAEPECSDSASDCAAQATTWDVCSNTWWKSQCKKTCEVC